MISARSASVTRVVAIRFALALGGSALLAISAHIAVPMLPVPITMQTLAIPLLVLLLGRNLAVITALLYLLEGAVGLPVFSPLADALPGLIGPTAGYIWSYPLAAAITGTLLQNGMNAGYVTRWAAVFAGTVAVFALGVAWLVMGFHLSLAQAFAAGVAPFVAGDLIKTSLAAALPSQAARIAGRFGL